MLERLWEKGSSDIVALKYYDENSSPWGVEAVMFFVENGIGKLQTVYGCAKDKSWKSFLLLNDIPLLKWHQHDDCFCPTCEKLISAGYGLQHVDESTIQTIRSHTNQPYEGIGKALEEFFPLLKLLPDGFYVLADLMLYPTDGERFFWSQTNTPQHSKATCTTHHNFRWIRAWPSYLLPTQLPDRYDKNTVNFYREQYRKGDGEKLRGFAFHIESYLCALLDGHHKAVAAALEGCDFRCLTILPVTGCSYYGKTEKKGWFGGVELGIADLGERIDEKRYFDFKYISTEETERFLTMQSSCWDEAVWPDELTFSTKRYPDVLGLACTKLAGELSSERIDLLLMGCEMEWEEKLDIVLRALIALKDARAKKLALDIGRNARLKELWDIAFRYLATIRSADIEEFFVNFLIDDDKRHPYLTKIADEYLNTSQ